MKNYYEDRTRYTLLRRSYTLMRIDGKAFHTYTKGLKRPFDAGLIEDMNLTAAYLCKNIQGAKFAYVQSDEISILITDFDDIATDMWFDGNIQKMTSVAASMATARFNQLRFLRLAKESGIQPRYRDEQYVSESQLEKLNLAMFDARIWQIPQSVEVENYFIWRQQDATRNSVSSVAQSLYSSKELHAKNSDQQQEMIWQKGVNWNDFSSREKRGGFIEKVEQEVPGVGDTKVKRSKWEAVECPIFTQNREFLKNKIPIL